MGLLDVYNQEYLNNPTDESTAYFRKDDMLPMLTDKEDHRETRKTFYIGVDLAISEKEKRAFTVFAVGGVDLDKVLNIVDIRRGRMGTLEIIDECFNLWERYHFTLMRFESEQIERTLRPVLIAEMRRRQIFFPIDWKPPLKDKEARARAFQYRMRAGNVRFDTDASWYPDLFEELTHFPRWGYKDQVDALAWLGDIIAEEYTPDTDEDLEEMEYQRMVRQDGQDGRCDTTGY
jgi:predicted phage terminase large subunit-like protein